MHLTATQVLAWQEYDALSRTLQDPLDPLREALRAAGDSREQTIDVLEGFFRAIVASRPPWRWRWLDQLAHVLRHAGRPHWPVLEEARALELADTVARLRRGDARDVMIVPAHPSVLCPACQAVRGMRLRVDHTIGRGPLPVVGCTCFTGVVPGLCTCWYALQDRPLPPLTLAEAVAILAYFEAMLARRARSRR